MKIKRIISQYRRDFYADYECEGCGFVSEHAQGYDDLNFHHNVVPKMKCPKCGKSTIDLGVECRALEPKYPEYVQV